MDVMLYSSFNIDPIAEAIFNVVFAAITIHAMIGYYNYKFGQEEDHGDKL